MFHKTLIWLFTAEFARCYISLGGGGDVQASQEERTSARVGASKFNDYAKRFLDLKNPAAKELSDQDTPRRDLSARAQAAAIKGAGLDGTGIKKRVASGLSQASGGTAADVMDRVSAAGRSAAESRGAIEPRLEERETRGLLSLGATGRGLQDSASMSLRKAGARATDAGIAARERKSAFETNVINSTTGLAGAGVSAYKEYRNKQKQQKQQD